MKISYNWLRSYIPEAPTAEELVDIFNYHLCEMESLEKRPDGDVIFDLKILPNRAHDLLSHQGVARELSSLLDIKFIDPTPKYKVPESQPTKLEIKIDTDKCRRYIGRIIKNVKIEPSPDWVIKYLESIGQRSINNIVDAANIVMFDCGQPTHAFDLDKVAEQKIIVKNATNLENESISMETLDGKICKLSKNDLVVASINNTLAIAGVKGGKKAEVNNGTKNIILECANFDPTFVRKTAQALNIFTDARKRFENDLSPELASYAILELSALIFEMCPDAIFEDIRDVYPKKQEKRNLSFSVDRISDILGVNVSITQVKDILRRYNFTYTEENGIFEIVIPPMRLDLVIEEDMAEEIGRILGYDKVKGTIPKINFKPKVNETFSKMLWARNKLLNDGYSEVMTYVFRDKGEVEVLASASDKKFLRTNLSDGLKESIKLNQANAPLLGIDKVKVFEIGTIFKKGGEEMHVAYGPARNASGIADAGGDKKSVTEVSLVDFCKGASIDFKLESRSSNLEAKFKMWSLFPFIARDIAVWVPENVKSEEVKKIITENMGDFVVRGPELFDEFKKLAPPEMGGGMRISYAFRLVFQSYDRTLTDAEANEIMVKIADKIKSNNDWQVR